MKQIYRKLLCCLRRRGELLADADYEWAILRTVWFAQNNAGFLGRSAEADAERAFAFLLSPEDFEEGEKLVADLSEEEKKAHSAGFNRAYNQLKADGFVAAKEQPEEHGAVSSFMLTTGDLRRIYYDELTKGGEQFVLDRFYLRGPKGRAEASSERFERALLVASLICNVVLALVK